jgi:hypothetical protein
VTVNKTNERRVAVNEQMSFAPREAILFVKKKKKKGKSSWLEERKSITIFAGVPFWVSSLNAGPAASTTKFASCIPTTCLWGVCFALLRLKHLLG